jgi:hypothetical protein
MLAFEKKWARDVLGGFAPVGGPGFAPHAGEVDYGDAAQRMMRATTRKAALGLRIALWLAVLAPLWLLGSLQTFGALSLEKRSEVLRRLLSHRLYAVRELTLFLKMTACMALFSLPSLRQRAHYDLPSASAETHLHLSVLADYEEGEP